ncbi:hypothetical protein FOCC_FOCC007513 [Frankliniella occidentalis]|nr:hypothetical protein FOCC_FOCC007513 [Frankliniella occidentalis]
MRPAHRSAHSLIAAVVTTGLQGIRHMPCQHYSVMLFMVPTASGLKCFQCGFYTDGVGSITPCINHTVELHLKECPKEKSKSCLAEWRIANEIALLLPEKYVSEGITVLACSDDCVEKGTSNITTREKSKLTVD